MSVNRIALLIAVMTTAGCSLVPAPAPAVATYDFGPVSASNVSAKIRALVAVEEVSAPSWLQTPAILYRLSSRDSAQVQPYSLARWAAPPSALVTHRLRSLFGQAAERGFVGAATGMQNEFVLRVELEGFYQQIDSATQARAIVRMRATLIDTAGRTLRAQRLFTAERASASVDSAGAVRSMIEASDVLLVELLNWCAQQTRAAS